MMPSKASGSTPPTAPGPGSRIESLDAFRGACALTVFLTHWLVWANFPPVGEAGRLLHDSLETAYKVFGLIIWNSDGQHPAVLAFFVLSGFCIHTSRARRAGTVGAAPEWRRYFLSRGRRILPVYWWGTFLGVGLVALQATWPSANPLFAPQVAGGLRDLLVRVFAVTAVVPGDVILGNWSLNTVSSEIAVYAIYPLLFVGTRRLGWMPLLAGLIALQFAGLALLPYVPMHWLFGSPLLMGAYWYLGMLAAEWHFKGGRPVPGWLVLLAWVLFLALRDLPFSAASHVVVQLVRALGFTFLLLWLVGRETRDPSLVRSGPIRWLRPVGQVSYSLYAVHPPVIMATTWALGFMPGYRSHAFQLLLTLVVPLLVTVVTYWFIERPYLLSAKAGPAPQAA